MLSISRNTPQAHHSLKNGVWIKKKLEGRELAYKTLGLIGCGRIGQKVAQIAKLGFNMEVVGYDIKPCPKAASNSLPPKKMYLEKPTTSAFTLAAKTSSSAQKNSPS